MGAVDQALEKCFEALGKKVAYHPWKFIIGSVVLTVLLASGYPKQEQENRPEKQWVAQGTPSIEQNDFIRSQWPSSSAFSAFVAVPKDGGNVLQAKYVKRLYEKYVAIMNIEVDGDKIADDLKAQHSANDDTEEWEMYRGKWVFDWSLDKTEETGYSRKCFEWGPFCAKSSILDIFKAHHNYPAPFADLSDEQVLKAVNQWTKMESMCPMSLANADSPCYATSCTEYTDETAADCIRKTSCYCSKGCPMEGTSPKDPLTCVDEGCVMMAEMMGGSSMMSNMCGPNGRRLSLSASNISRIQDGMQATLQASERRLGMHDGGDYTPTPIERYIGGLARDGGKIVSGKSLMTTMSLKKDEYRDKKTQRRADFVSLEWEKEALCILGIDATGGDGCPEDDLFIFHAQFPRSWSDEFGSAIRADLGMIGIAYFLMILYLFMNLGKPDSVHRMVAVCFSVLAIIGLSTGSSFGLAAHIGVPVSQLTNQVYFLLLGLGVDDAFVLVTEYMRAATLYPEQSVEDWVVKSCKHGGMSILITSATDALAFLIGASTVLPALSWFCVYAGLAVLFCFIYQIIFFLPVLVINGRRAHPNRDNKCCGITCCTGTRVDCCCCLTAKDGEHLIDQPKGCCGCCNCKQPLLPKLMDKFGSIVIDNNIGRMASVVVFVAMAAAGIAGCTMIKQDFKLEWFVPGDSYVQDFFKISEEQYASGTRMAIYSRDIDHFSMQKELAQAANYMQTSKYVDKDQDIMSWIEQFQTYAKSNSAVTGVDADGIFPDSTTFYAQLFNWVKGPGSKFSTSLKWADSGCDEADSKVACDPQLGLKSTRMNCVIKLEFVDEGQDRYDTMVGMREDMNNIIKPDGDKPLLFPFDFQFLYWEEVGIVGEELWRNIIICAVVITAMVVMLIPVPRIALCVCACIVLSILEVVGFCHYWDLSISGVSSIYILVCIGLAVDYSAHIAHMFKESAGSSKERAKQALVRIGPAVIQAIISTFLAVVVLAFSKSFVFVVFFKCIFLVVFIAGGHGLWAVPVVLSFFGGSKEASEEQKSEQAKGVSISIPGDVKAQGA